MAKQLYCPRCKEWIVTDLVIWVISRFSGKKLHCPKCYIRVGAFKSWMYPKTVTGYYQTARED